MTSEQQIGKNKRNSATRPKAERFNEFKFVQYEPDDEQKKLIKAWEIDEAGVFDAIERMVTDGYKFSIKFDEYGDCFGCYITCPPEHPSGNGGLILSGRGSSAWKSVKQALWKHGIALQGSWQGFVERANGSRIDD